MRTFTSSVRVDGLMVEITYPCPNYFTGEGAPAFQLMIEGQSIRQQVFLETPAAVEAVADMLKKHAATMREKTA